MADRQEIDETQRTIEKYALDYYISRQIELFFLDRRATGLSSGSIRFYAEKLRPFQNYCDSQMVTSITEIDAALLRGYMLLLEEKGHSKGGQHAHYRALRAFLRWFEQETEPEGWRNPIDKIKAPRVPAEILPPATTEHIQKLLKVCNKDSIYGLRDSAIILLLADAGLRASEVLSLNCEDVDNLGTLRIRRGKGGKDRAGFIGKKTRLALKKYLAVRKDDHPALFVNRYGIRMDYDGLRGIITRRAAEAGIPAPSLHSFRRAYALSMIRAGVDIYTLAKLMGHSSIAVLSRYLKITEDDTREAHRKAGPVDHLVFGGK